jgi:hypothetical protein
VKKSDLTNKIVAYSLRPHFFIMDDVIDWAFEMLQAGYETPDLLYWQV